MPLKESKNTIRSSETRPCQKEQTSSPPAEKKTVLANRTRALILFVVLLGCAIPFVCTNKPQYSGCDDIPGSSGSLGNINIPKENTEQFLGKWRSKRPIKHLGWHSSYSQILKIGDWTPPAKNGPKETIKVGEQTATLKRPVDFIVEGFIHHRGGIYQMPNGDYVMITWCDLGADCINAVRREGDNLMLGRSKGQDCRKLVHPPYSWEELKPVPNPKKP